jgi:hypothetical protein
MFSTVEKHNVAFMYYAGGNDGEACTRGQKTLALKWGLICLESPAHFLSLQPLRYSELRAVGPRRRALTQRRWRTWEEARGGTGLQFIMEL